MAWDNKSIKDYTLENIVDKISKKEQLIQLMIYGKNLVRCKNLIFVYAYTIKYVQTTNYRILVFELTKDSGRQDIWIGRMK